MIEKFCFPYIYRGLCMIFDNFFSFNTRHKKKGYQEGTWIPFLFSDRDDDGSTVKGFCQSIPSAFQKEKWREKRKGGKKRKWKELKPFQKLSTD